MVNTEEVNNNSVIRSILLNDDYLKRLSSEASETVCAWSDDGGYMDRDLMVFPLLFSPKCLTILKSGRPGHPLYKNKELKPIPYAWTSQISLDSL